ncbi:MAG TPA: hypothetical protein VL978_16390 [Puia sp.]|nr:hypothetical protein [Puia sp.]
MIKYLSACGNNTRKAMTLYRANIRLSTEIFSILCLFEVALRNATNVHYRGTLGNNWLFDAAQPGGFLHATGCEKSLESVEKVIANLGVFYTPDKAIAELTFGFWTYQFASKEFAAAGCYLYRLCDEQIQPDPGVAAVAWHKRRFFSFWSGWFPAGKTVHRQSIGPDSGNILASFMMDDRRAVSLYRKREVVSSPKQPPGIAFGPHSEPFGSPANDTCT